MQCSDNFTIYNTQDIYKYDKYIKWIYDIYNQIITNVGFSFPIYNKKISYINVNCHILTFNILY